MSWVSSVSPLVLTPIDWSKRYLETRIVRGLPNGALFFYDDDGAIVITTTGQKRLAWPTADGWQSSRSKGNLDVPSIFYAAVNVVHRPAGSIALLRANGLAYELVLLLETGTEKVLARMPNDWTPSQLLTADDAQHVDILGHHEDGVPELSKATLVGGVTSTQIPGLECPKYACGWMFSIADSRGLALSLEMGDGPPRVANAAITRDGGLTWSKLSVPSSAIADLLYLGMPEAGANGPPASVGEAGMLVGGVARLGWDPRDDSSAGDVDALPRSR